MNSPEDMVFDLVQATAFPDQPAGRPILGTVNSVKGFSRHHLSAYLATHYQRRTWCSRPPAPSITRGCLPKPSACWAARHRARRQTPRRPLYRGGVARSEKPFEQTHLVLAFEAPPYRHPDYFAAQVLRRRAWRRHVLAAVPGGARAPRALLRDPRLRLRPFRQRHVRHLRGVRARPRRSAPRRDPRRAPARRRARLQRGRDRPRQGAGQDGPARRA